MPASSCQRRIVSAQRSGSPTMIKPRAISEPISRSLSLRFGIRRVVNIAIVFHERRRLAHATLKTIRNVDVKLAEHFAFDEVVAGARQLVAVHLHWFAQRIGARMHKRHGHQLVTAFARPAKRLFRYASLRPRY